MIQFFKKSLTFIKSKSKIFVILFFVALFSIGFVVYDDYGMSWDEPLERQILQSNINHIYKTLLPSVWEKDSAKNPEFFKSIPDLNTFIERDHGQIPYYPLGIVDFIMKWPSDVTYYNHNFNPVLTENMVIPNVESQYKLRHFYNFSICFISLIFLYFTVKLLTKRRLYGIISVILFFISPRFFAESFYNSKDLITFAVSLITIYFASNFILNRKISTAIALSFFGAIAFNMRISTVLFLLIAAIICIITFIFSKEKATLRNWITLISSVLGCFIFYLILSPAAWGNPIELLQYIVGSAVQFRWNNPVIFDGILSINKPLDSGLPELPSNYIVKMIMLTTPIAILLFFIIGIISILIKSVKMIINKTSTRVNSILLSLILYVVLSIVLPIILDSIVYNSWRHFYYLYGPMLIIATIGSSMVWNYFNSHKNKVVNMVKFAVPIILFIQIGFSSYWCIANHPYQFTYYNFLAGNKPFDLYEGDYWNVSAKQCLEKLLKNTPGNVKIGGADYTSADALVKGAAMLDESSRKRIKFGGLDSEYILTNVTYYQMNNSQGKEKVITFDDSKKMLDNKKYYSANVDGQPIMLIVENKFLLN